MENRRFVERLYYFVGMCAIQRIAKENAFALNCTNEVLPLPVPALIVGRKAIVF
jgi:hypothetical protein